MSEVRVTEAVEFSGKRRANFQETGVAGKRRRRARSSVGARNGFTGEPLSLGGNQHRGRDSQGEGIWLGGGFRRWRRARDHARGKAHRQVGCVPFLLLLRI